MPSPLNSASSQLSAAYSRGGSTPHLLACAARAAASSSAGVRLSTPSAGSSGDAGAPSAISSRLDLDGALEHHLGDRRDFDVVRSELFVLRR